MKNHSVEGFIGGVLITLVVIPLKGLMMLAPQ